MIFTRASHTEYICTNLFEQINEVNVASNIYMNLLLGKLYSIKIEEWDWCINLQPLP